MGEEKLNEKIRERAKELMEVGNTINDNHTQQRKLGNEIDKLITFRDERGNEIITRLVDQRFDSIEDLQMIDNAKELISLIALIDEKQDKLIELELEVERLQVYRAERAQQLLGAMIDSKNYVMKQEQIQ